jgi:hypothetical protein
MYGHRAEGEWVMCRRVASHYVLKMKLQRSRLPEQTVDDRVILSGLLENGMAAQAQAVAARQPGLCCARLAYLSSALACDRVLHCSLFEPSGSQDVRILDEVLRRRYALPPGAAGDQQTLLTPRMLVAHWPEWLVALFDLLCLTRRSWAYLRLFTARVAGTGWPRRLGQLVWGLESHRDWLLGELAELESVGQDLEQAYDAVARGGATDPVEVFLRAAGQDLGTAGTGGLDVLWSHWPQTLPATSIRPHLLAALADLERLGHQPGRAFVAAAWDELSEEVRRPVTPAPVREKIQIVLGASPEAFRNEPTTTAVLTAIGSVAPETVAPPIHPPSEGVLPLQGLIACLLQRANQRPADWFALLRYIIHLLLQGYDFDALRRNLAPSGPGPTELDVQLLELVQQRLCGWLQVVLNSATSVLSCEYWEMPPAPQADPPALSDAAQEMGRWLESPGGRPESWGPLPGAMPGTIVAAVLSVCLDVLSRAMADCYREHNAAQPHAR